MTEEGVGSRFVLIYQQFRSYHDEKETWNWVKILSSMLYPQWGLSVAKAPWTALQNAAHL